MSTKKSKLTGVKRKTIDTDQKTDKTSDNEMNHSSTVPSPKKHKINGYMMVNNKGKAEMDFLSSDDDTKDNSQEVEDIDVLDLKHGKDSDEDSWRKLNAMVTGCKSLESKGFGALPHGFKFKEDKCVTLMVCFNTIGEIYGDSDEIYTFLVDYIKSNCTDWGIKLSMVKGMKVDIFKWNDKIIDSNSKPKQKLDSVIEAFNQHYRFGDLNIKVIECVERNCTRLTLDGC